MSVDFTQGKGYFRYNYCRRGRVQLGLQGFINIGVVTYILPNTGLPLPFVSYGLTSLVCSFIEIGFVLNVGLQCKEK